MTDTKQSTAPMDGELEQKKKKKSEPDDKAQCRHGFHDYVEKEGEHTDEQGKPVKLFKCSSCGKEKTQAD
ncbi:hypothetical protein SAMN02745866_00256 [Alteromonadaceae bacterium Bs31]|nr:hypothetical protein SAMN02745866_00256 [Alteromonadaceae bacterium Bs31]